MTASATTLVTGTVVQVIGPVLDIEFPPDQLPEIYNALLVEDHSGPVPVRLTAEVQQHIGRNQVRAVAMSTTDAVVRDRRLDTLTAALSLEPIPIDVEVANAWARLRLALRDADLRMSVNDSWIAATAMALDVPIVTQDDDFPTLAGLDVINV